MMPRDEYFLSPNEDTITGIDWARIRDLILCNQENSRRDAIEIGKITVKEAKDDGDYEEEEGEEENDLRMKRFKKEITRSPGSTENARFF